MLTATLPRNAAARSGGSKRRFLFLQGVCSPFFAGLADRLAADGHKVFKVNFNAGDLAYWGIRNSTLFAGRPQDLHDFLDGIYRRFGITDQILFGDRRPVHRPAVDHAETLGIRTHVFEEGYFRPYWITLEREGVNGHSLLPRDPDWFREVGARVPDYGDGSPFSSPFWVRAAHDVAYHLGSALNPLLFPRYRTHAPINAAIEYAAYLRRFSLLRLWAPRDKALIDQLTGSGGAFYVLPLQLNSDAQIRDHSRFDGMVDVMEFVLESFARCGPADARLLIKNHPLDMGLIDYAKVIRSICARLDLDGRIDYVESGDLTALLGAARGVVTVNSTVGAQALLQNCPTVALSDPIYNLPGLTFQGSLDDFWTQARQPERELFRRFRNTVIHTTQVNGGFYSRAGIDLAIRNCLPRLENERSPLEELA